MEGKPKRNNSYIADMFDDKKKQFLLPVPSYGWLQIYNVGKMTEGSFSILKYYRQKEINSANLKRKNVGYSEYFCNYFQKHYICSCVLFHLNISKLLLLA